MYRFGAILLSMMISTVSNAEIIKKEVRYEHDGVIMHGMIAYDDAVKGSRPGVLVVHEWWGHNEYARNRALQLAGLGFTAMAVDMYGDGKTADHPKDAGKFSSAVAGNLPMAKARFDKAIATLRDEPTVSDDDIAAIGYCFGGGILLNMARMGTDISGVVSYHGSLATSSPAKMGDIHTRIRVFHGADDPFIKPEHIKAFKTEMNEAGADYQFVEYPGAVHSFTNPGADAVGKKFGLPLAYDEHADKDSWEKTLTFFEEIFR